MPLPVFSDIRSLGPGNFSVELQAAARSTILNSVFVINADDCIKLTAMEMRRSE
jgi:hypothetical protein